MCVRARVRMSTTWRESPRLQVKVITGLNLMCFTHTSCSLPTVYPNLFKKLEKEDQIKGKG